ncbi:MAG: HEAT repeat domain-containing protein, partial [Candidatus Omnitrophica bacterium]|nr:HEAT repeat domain-containing protein [Candidatus Omnitrophota bacterium]
MQTKSSSPAGNDLIRFFGSAVRSLEKGFGPHRSPKKPVSVQPAPQPSEKSPVVNADSYVKTLSAILSPLTTINAAPPKAVAVQAKVPVPRVEPADLVSEIAIPEVPLKSTPVSVHVPVAEKKVLSQQIGLQGIEFSSKAEQVEAEIYFRDLQSPSKRTRSQALREIKKLPRNTAASMLEQLLSIEQDTLQIIEILNASASIFEEASTPKKIFKNYARHEDVGIRLAALRSISKYHDEESFEILSSCMKDKNAGVRRQMLHCLCWSFGERCVPFAINALHDSDPGVRKAASQIVGALKINQAISGLITLLSDLDKDVQSSAAVAVKKITGE